MKRRTGLMVLAGFMVGVSGVNADALPDIPLMVCNDGITQNYNGLLAADTLDRIDYDLHSDANCVTGAGTLFGSNGSFNLASGASSFQLCYNDTANSLPQRVCNVTGCGNTTCSFQVVQLNATGGSVAFGTGDCVNVVCSGGSPTSWSLFSSGTLSF